MNQLLTTADLISRMTPTTLAAMIANLEQLGSLDAVELHTAHALRTALACNVGDSEAAKFIEAASR